MIFPNRFVRLNHQNGTGLMETTIRGFWGDGTVLKWFNANGSCQVTGKGTR